jgi:hypothetical protein
MVRAESVFVAWQMSKLFTVNVPWIDAENIRRFDRRAAKW